MTPVIARNSVNRIIVLGSFTSSSNSNPKIVIPTDTMRMFKNFLLIILKVSGNLC